GVGDAQRRRPSRPLRRVGAVVREAPEIRDAEDLQRLPTWHADHGSRHDQCRPPGLSEGRRQGSCCVSKALDQVSERPPPAVSFLRPHGVGSDSRFTFPRGAVTTAPRLPLTPVDFSYTPPFRFSGKLGRVTVELT